MSTDEVRVMMEEFLAKSGSPEEDFETYRQEVEGLSGNEFIRWTIWHLGVITGVHGDRSR